MPVVFNLLKTLAGHGYDVNSVAFSRDGKRLVSGGGDRTARIWELDGYEVGLMVEHGEWINGVCFAPSGQAFVTAARDGSVKLWSAENGQLFGTIQAHAKGANDAAFTPDGRRLVTGGNDGAVRIFNLREKRIERSINAHTGWVWAVAASGEGVASCGADGAARLWSVETG
jgi:WD40 repeat protein